MRKEAFPNQWKCRSIRGMFMTRIGCSTSAEIQLADLCGSRKVLRPALEGDRTGFQDMAVMRDTERHGSVLLRNQNGKAGFGEPPDRIFYLVDDDRGQSLGGLVQEQASRAGHEASGDRYHLYAGRWSITHNVVPPCRRSFKTISRFCISSSPRPDAGSSNRRPVGSHMIAMATPSIFSCP